MKRLTEDKTSGKSGYADIIDDIARQYMVNWRNLAQIAFEAQRVWLETNSKLAENMPVVLDLMVKQVGAANRITRLPIHSIASDASEA